MATPAFPASPTSGQTFSFNGSTWEWNPAKTRWELLPETVGVGGGAPAAATTGSALVDGVTGSGPGFPVGLDSQNLILLGSAGITVPTITMKTSTGYARGYKWDASTTAQGGSGAAPSPITLTWGSLASPYTTYGLVKQFAVGVAEGGSFTTDAADVFTYLQIASASLTFLRVPENHRESLQELEVVTYSGTDSFSVSGFPSLWRLKAAVRYAETAYVLRSPVTVLELTGGVRYLVFDNWEDLMELRLNGSHIVNPEGLNLAADLLYYETSTDSVDQLDLTPNTSLADLVLRHNVIGELSLPASLRTAYIAAAGTNTNIIVTELKASCPNLVSLTAINSTTLSTVNFSSAAFATSLESCDFSVSVGVSGTINLTGCSALEVFKCTSANASGLNVTGCSALKQLDVSNSSNLTTITGAADLSDLEDPAGSAGSVNLTSCGLTSVAIDAFFDALPVTSNTVTLKVTGNPGAGACTPSIATSKGYTVTT